MDGDVRDAPPLFAAFEGVLAWLRDEGEEVLSIFSEVREGGIADDAEREKEL